MGELANIYWNEENLGSSEFTNGKNEKVNFIVTILSKNTISKHGKYKLEI